MATSAMAPVPIITASGRSAVVDVGMGPILIYHSATPSGELTKAWLISYFYTKKYKYYGGTLLQKNSDDGDIFNHTNYVTMTS